MTTRGADRQAHRRRNAGRVSSVVNAVACAADPMQMRERNADVRKSGVEFRMG